MGAIPVLPCAASVTVTGSSCSVIFVSARLGWFAMTNIFFFLLGFSFSTKRKEKSKGSQVHPEIFLQGALVWTVKVSVAAG